MILDLLTFLIQSPADVYDSWQNDWSRQENESTTFWERSGGHLDPDPDSGSGLIWKSVFESRITFAWDFGLGGGLRSLNTVWFYWYFMKIRIELLKNYSADRQQTNRYKYNKKLSCRREAARCFVFVVSFKFQHTYSAVFTARRICIARICRGKTSVRLSHAGIVSKPL